jgi:hypothetical protein
MNPEDGKDEDREEVRAIHRRHHSCSDGMCGAKDCKRCRPGWSWDEPTE